MGSLAEVLSNRVRVIRAKKKLTQEELASRTGYSIQYISKIETQPANVTIEALERLALGLEVAPSVLVSEKGVLRIRRPTIKRDLARAMAALQKISDQILE
jgi:transcriptional regulator with XRE-family HTH domain